MSYTDEPPTAKFRCRKAMQFGPLATRCQLDAGHENENHLARGLPDVKHQSIEWRDGERGEFETDREDRGAWRRQW